MYKDTRSSYNECVQHFFVIVSTYEIVEKIWNIVSGSCQHLVFLLWVVFFFYMSAEQKWVHHFTLIH